MQKTTIILLTLAVAFLLASCGGGGKPDVEHAAYIAADQAGIFDSDYDSQALAATNALLDDIEPYSAEYRTKQIDLALQFLAGSCEACLNTLEEHRP